MTDINEDLRKWFKEKWVRFDTKGNIKGDCAKEPGEGKPKCLPMAKAHALGKKQRASAARRKRRQDPHAERKGKAKFVKTVKEENINEIRDIGLAARLHIRRLKREANALAKNPKMSRSEKIKYALTHAGMKGHEAAETIWDYPMNVTTPAQGALYATAGALGGSALKIADLTKKLNQRKRRKTMKEEVLLEKNVPTNPKLWAQAKAQAKKKFKIYPSAYANGWAAKWYKSKGGGWKSLNEDYEHEMARNELRTAMRGIERLMKHLDGEGELEAWVQSKLTKAADYIDTLADYMDSRDDTVKEAYELIEEAKKKMDKRIPQTVQNMTPGSNPYADDSNCPTYVATPGQAITEAKVPKTPSGVLRRVRKEIAGGARGQRREVLKQIAKAAYEKRKEEKEKKKTASEPLYPGPKKTGTPTKPSKAPAKQMVPPMEGEKTPAERIAKTFNRPGYTSKKETPMSQEPTFQDALNRAESALKKHLYAEPEDKGYDHKKGEHLLNRFLDFAEPEYHETKDQSILAKMKKYRTLHSNLKRTSMNRPSNGLVRRVLRTIGVVKEEHGAGDTGTAEVTNKYIEHTPGQLPLDDTTKVKKKLSDTIKNIVKEEVLSEAVPRIGVGKTTRRTIRFQEKRRPSPAGRKVTLKRPTAKHNIAMRGPVAPKRPRPTTTAVGGKRIATKAARFATKLRRQTILKTRKSQTAGSTLTRAARG